MKFFAQVAVLSALTPQAHNTDQHQQVISWRALEKLVSFFDCPSAPAARNLPKSAQFQTGLRIVIGLSPGIIGRAPFLALGGD